jgi:hypothetical protein
MRLRDQLRLACAFCLLGLAFLGAQPAARPKLEVTSAHFTLVTVPGASARWLEADVELDVRVIGGRSLFVDRVKVVLNLGARTLGGGYRYYRSEMEAVTLENGPAHFRFYLPAEVVKRDGLTGEMEFWAVQLAAGGAAVPETPRNVNVTLRDPALRRAFEKDFSAGAPANDGVLVPQHLSPFAASYPTATPSPVRRQ